MATREQLIKYAGAFERQVLKRLGGSVSTAERAGVSSMGHTGTWTPSEAAARIRTGWDHSKSSTDAWTKALRQQGHNNANDLSALRADPAARLGFLRQQGQLPLARGKTNYASNYFSKGTPGQDYMPWGMHNDLGGRFPGSKLPG